VTSGTAWGAEAIQTCADWELKTPESSGSDACKLLTEANKCFPQEIIFQMVTSKQR